MKAQAEDDAWQARLHARGCLIQEERDHHRVLDIGSAAEPHFISGPRAWQHAYAHCVLVGLDGDYARLTATALSCRASIAVVRQDQPMDAAEMLRAAELCEQAAKMLERAGAVDDDGARQLLLAGSRRETMMIRLGYALPSAAESMAQDVQCGLWDIDTEP